IAATSGWKTASARWAHTSRAWTRRSWRPPRPRRPERPGVGARRPTLRALSTTGIEPSPVRLTAADAPRPDNTLRLNVLVFAHAVTDFLSFVIIPLMTVLKGRVSFDAEHGAILLGVGSVASGVVQPIVAWVSDRFDTRWLGTLGLAVAAVAIGLVG